MQQRIMNVLNQMQNRWQALGRPTQAKLVTAVVVLLLAIGGTVFVLTRPDMVIVANDMDPAELSQAIQIMSDNGIKANPAQGTTSLEVPSKDLDRARMLLATNDIQSDEFTYADALNVGIGTTESTKKTMDTLAKQTTIEHTLKTIDGVKNASVILSIPNASPFIIRDQDMPTASVMLELTKPLSSLQSEVIANHVAKSVTNLKLENVSVTDSSGNSLFSAGPDGSLAGITGKQAEIEYQKKTEIEEKVKSLLGQQYDSVETMATMGWDWSYGTRDETRYTPPVEGATSGVPTHESISTSEVENSEPAAEPGVQGNNGENPEYPVGTPGSSSATTETTETDRIYNVEVTSTTVPTGTWNAEESSLAIMTYINRVYKQDDVDLTNTTWEDFKTNLKLNPIQLPSITDQAAYDQQLNLIRSATGIENVVISGYERPVFEDSIPRTRPINQLLMGGLLLLLIALLAFGLIRRTQPVEITEIEPELSVEDLLISSSPQEESGLGDVEESVPEIDYFAESELKKQIDKFVDDKPEAAAQLLRNWLSDEWE